MKNTNFLRYARGEFKEESYCQHYARSLFDFPSKNIDVKTRTYTSNTDFLGILSTIVDNMKKAGYSVSDIDIKITFAKEIDAKTDFVQLININNDYD